MTTYEQQPLVNSGPIFEVPLFLNIEKLHAKKGPKFKVMRVVVVHGFDYIKYTAENQLDKKTCSLNCLRPENTIA